MEGEVNSVRNDKKRVNQDDDAAKPVGDVSRVSTDGPHKYYHFQAFEFDGHSFQINDSVLVTPEEGKIKPTVLIIKDIFQTEDGDLMIEGQRLYRPEECTIKGSGIMQSKNGRELFYSSKIVKVPANAVMHTCVIHLAPNNEPTPDRNVQHGFFVKKTYDFERNELRDLTQQECRGRLQQDIGLSMDDSGARHTRRCGVTASSRRAQAEQQVDPFGSAGCSSSFRPPSRPIVGMLTPRSSPSSAFYASDNASHSVSHEEENILDYVREPNRELELEEDHLSEDEEEEEYVPIMHPGHAVGATLAVGGSRSKKAKKSRTSESSTADVKARRADESWVLRTPVVGGPMDITLLRSFGGHVVYKELQGQGTRDVYQFRIRHPPVNVKILTDWLRRMSAEAYERVQASGLIQLHACVDTQIDTALVAAFVERWQPDTNTFHMPFGEITILLSDVFYILGIRSDGDLLPQQPPPAIHEHLKDIFQGDEKILDEYYEFGRRGMRQKRIRDLMLAGEFGDDNHARAWILTALGNTLFADKSGNRFRPKDVVEVANVSGLADRYCWGAATLANLYRQLGVSSRANTSGMGGCVALLQCWIYEYFPSLRPSTVRLHFPRTPPTALTMRTSMKDNSMERFLHLRSLIDSMTPRDVCWTPFGPGAEVIQRIPMTLYMGVISYRDIIETYAPARCLRQLGYVQGIPAAPLRPESDWRGREPKLYKVEWSPGVLKHDWAARDFMVVPHRLCVAWSYPGEARPDYLQWYQNISHLIIGAPPTPNEAAAPPRGHDRWADAMFGELQEAFACMDLIEPDRAWSCIATMQDLHSQYIRGGRNSEPCVRRVPPESRRRQPPPPP